MQIERPTPKQKDYLSVIAVVWVVLTSGTMIFNICNMLFSMLVLLGLAFLILIKTKKFSAANVKSFIFLVLFTAASTLYNGMENVVTNDLVIMAIRLFSLMVIMSGITKEKFAQVYINTIYIIALVSLPCFFLKLLSPNLTFPFTVMDAENDFYGTFYYTLGSLSKGVFNRNCGIFWEAGLFQLYLNYALALLVSNKNASVSKPVKKFIVLSLAVVTTVSTMGYLCYGLVILLILANREKAMNRMLLRLALFAVVGLLAVESTAHIIEGKIIDKGMSYGSRYDDTMISVEIAKDYPLLGVGPVNDHVSITNRYTAAALGLRLTSGELARSNGLGNFVIKFGIPVSIIYLFLLYRRNKSICGTDAFNAATISILLIAGFINEPIMFTTLWLSFFMEWKVSGQKAAQGRAAVKSAIGSVGDLGNEYGHRRAVFENQQ